MNYPYYYQPVPQPGPRLIRKYDCYGNVYYSQEPDPAAYPQTQTDNPASQRQSKPSQTFIVVKSEKEAENYEIDPLDVGKIHVFAMEDDTAMFAKRINPSNFNAEFEAYDKRKKDNKSEKTSAPDSIDKELFISMDNRLQKIEKFIDTASDMFLNGLLSNTKPKQKKDKLMEPEED